MSDRLGHSALAQAARDRHVVGVAAAEVERQHAPEVVDEQRVGRRARGSRSAACRSRGSASTARWPRAAPSRRAPSARCRPALVTRKKRTKRKSSTPSTVDGAVGDAADEVGEHHRRAPQPPCATAGHAARATATASSAQAGHEHGLVPRAALGGPRCRDVEVAVLEGRERHAERLRVAHPAVHERVRLGVEELDPRPLALDDRAHLADERAAAPAPFGRVAHGEEAARRNSGSAKLAVFGPPALRALSLQSRKRKFSGSG